METLITVLVVEDIFLIRLDMTERLQEAGFNVVEASTADEAIGILENRADIQIVMTDIEMPGTMDGLALAHHVRERWPPTILVVTSGARHPKKEHLPIGATFIPKPINHSALLDHLKLVGGQLAG